MGESGEISDRVKSGKVNHFLKSKFPHASNLLWLTWNVGISEAWEYDKMITEARSIITRMKGNHELSLKRFKPMEAEPVVRFNYDKGNNEFVGYSCSQGGGYVSEGPDSYSDSYEKSVSSTTKNMGDNELPIHNYD